MDSAHHEWLNKWQREIQEEYDRLHQIAKTDPQQAGHGGEISWASLLREWLPPGYSVGTRKYILMEDGSESFETDIVIFNPGYPAKLQEKEQVLAGGVAAAFSVKLSLNAAGIKDAADRAAKLRRGLKVRSGSVSGEISGPFFVGLLAHSHGWKSPGSDPRKNLIDNVNRYDLEFASNPRESLDLICVADLTAASTSKNKYMNPSTASIYDIYGIDSSQGVITQGVVFADSNSPLSPIASFMTSLVNKLAQNDPTLRPFANNLRLTGLAESGGGSLRVYEAGAVLSEHLMNRLQSGYYYDSDDWVGHYL